MTIFNGYLSIYTLDPINDTKVHVSTDFHSSMEDLDEAVFSALKKLKDQHPEFKGSAPSLETLLNMDFTPELLRYIDLTNADYSHDKRYRYLRLKQFCKLHPNSHHYLNERVKDHHRWIRHRVSENKFCALNIPSDEFELLFDLAYSIT